MIHYQLRCDADHGFDGWFKDSSAFERLAAQRLVECPTCGSQAVERALMAPSIATRGAGRRRPVPETVDQSGKPVAPPPVPAPDASGPAALAAEMPARMRALLQRLRAAVERDCDYVGADFAAEARRIHRGKADARGIYGEATPDEAEALAEDGIDVTQIPWLPRADG